MEAVFFGIILLSFYSPTVTYSEWIVHSDNTIPRDDTTMAVGSYNGSVYLLGGFDRDRQQTKYDIKSDTFVFYKSGFVASGNKISGEAQYWTQMGFNLYFLNDFDPANIKISVFNMKDNSFRSEFDKVPNRMSDGKGRACVTSSPLFNKIFINGGFTTAEHVLTSTSVLNLETMGWEEGSQMKIARRSHTCIIHPNAPILYSIGGNSIDGILTETIEKVHIENIHDNEWTFFNGNLSNPSMGLRSLIYGNNIIIIGGLNGREIYNTMHILDTENNLLTVSEMTLAFNSVYSAAIMVDNIMYSFGGPMGEDMDLWQSFTTSPIIATPTSAPVATVTGKPTAQTVPTAPTAPTAIKIPDTTVINAALIEGSKKEPGLSPVVGDVLLCVGITLLICGVGVCAMIYNKRANAKKEFQQLDDDTDRNTVDNDVLTCNESDSDSNANKTPINADGTKLIHATPTQQ